MKTFDGKLLAYVATGTEGIIWCMQTDHDKEQCSYENLHPLTDGDRLIVWDECGKNMFDDAIDIDTSRTEIKGYWCRGVQKNVDDDIWFNLFDKRYYAKLIREQR